MTGTLQQIIPGKVPEGDPAICHIPGIVFFFFFVI